MIRCRPIFHQRNRHFVKANSFVKYFFDNRYQSDQAHFNGNYFDKLGGIEMFPLITAAFLLNASTVNKTFDKLISTSYEFQTFLNNALLIICTYNISKKIYLYLLYIVNQKDFSAICKLVVFYL